MGGGVMILMCRVQLFLSDPDVKFGQSIGWTANGRLARFAMIIDNGKVVYAEREPGREVTVSVIIPYHLISSGPKADRMIGKDGGTCNDVLTIVMQVSGADAILAKL